MSVTGSRPSPAGMYDYFLGGHHYSEADREAAEEALAIAPEGGFAARENRAFMQRAVRYCASRGVRQYIDVGSGYPTAGPVHEVAAETVDGPRILYVDYDPSVAELSRRLDRPPHVEVVTHDLREPWAIINDPVAKALIDWSQPVALLLVSILHFIPDVDNPGEIIAMFREQLAPGSYLVICHASDGENPDAAAEAPRAWKTARSGLTLRSPAGIEALFNGFELVGPGLVTSTEWGTGKPAPVNQILGLAGVALLS
jgi:O-methyltransferase involved in polyketide biosynthesis